MCGGLPAGLLPSPSAPVAARDEAVTPRACARRLMCVWGRCPWNAVFRNPPVSLNLLTARVVCARGTLGGGLGGVASRPRRRPACFRAAGRRRPLGSMASETAFPLARGPSFAFCREEGWLPSGEGFLNLVRLKRRPLSRSPRLVFPPRPAARSVRWLFRASVRVFLIDVVTSRSPGPGLSRAGRGTDIPGEWGRSSRSARGPLSSPSPPGWAVCGKEKGVRNPARPRSSASLPLGATGGARGLDDAADTLRPPFLAVSRGRPLPAAGRGVPPTRRAIPPGRASAFRFGPLVAPGALLVVAQVPEAEQVLSSPVPREPSPRGRPLWRCSVGGPRLGVSPAGQGRQARVPRPRVRGGPDLRRCPGGVGARERGRAGDAGRWLNREVSVAAVLLSWAG